MANIPLSIASLVSSRPVRRSDTNGAMKNEHELQGAENRFERMLRDPLLVESGLTSTHTPWANPKDTEKAPTLPEPQAESPLATPQRGQKLSLLAALSEVQTGRKFFVNLQKAGEMTTKKNNRDSSQNNENSTISTEHQENISDDTVKLAAEVVARRVKKLSKETPAPQEANTASNLKPTQNSDMEKSTKNSATHIATNTTETIAEKATELAKQEHLPVTGKLSAQFESGKDGIAAIGWDKRSGTLYGKYQIASKTGTMQEFLGFLGQKEPQLARRLRNAGPMNTGRASGGMANEWKQIAKEMPEKFEALQNEYIYITHYETARDKINSATGVNIDNHSNSLREVLWSTAVQHGPSGAASIFSKAIPKVSAKESQKFDEELTKLVYKDRKTKFTAFSIGIQNAIKNRFVKEQQLAIQMLKESDIKSKL